MLQRTGEADTITTHYLFALGAYISVINMAGVLVGPGWHSLILAVLGGLGMFVAGWLGYVRWRR